MQRIHCNTIIITRGDTLEAELTIRMTDWRRFKPTEGDKIRFALKSTFDDAEPLIVKDIPINKMILRLEAEETKRLEPRRKPYVYDVELRTPGDRLVSTVITGEMYVMEEVY